MLRNIYLIKKARKEVNREKNQHKMREKENKKARNKSNNINKIKKKSIQCEFKQCSQKAERQGITLWPVTGHSRVPFQCIISHNQLYNG